MIESKKIGPERRCDQDRRRGVIILEILVVMIILALLITLVAPNYLGLGEKAKATVTRSNINSLVLGLKFYHARSSTFPSTEQGLQALMQKPDVGNIPKNWEGPYMDANRLPLDGWENKFQYTSDGRVFEIKSLGADGREGGSELNADISSKDL